MNFAPHQPDTGPDAYLRDAVAGSIRHADDIAQLLLGSPQRWTDALLSEVRAHLSGGLNTVETALGLHLGDSWLARPVEALGPGYCRLAIERHPAILSPILLDHLRLRAAAAIALRMTLSLPADLQDGSVSAEPMLEDEPLSAAMAALALSVDPWLAPHPLDWPMQADIGAEAFCDLVWTASALLVEGLTARMGVEHGAAATLMANAAETIIARHDEQAGPFARAAYVATLARTDEIIERLADHAALRHDLLLLAALGGRRAGMPVEHALALLVDGVDEERAAFAHRLALNDAAFLAMLDALAPVGDGADDDRLPELLDHFRTLTTEDAAAALARWRGPVPLVTKLSRMGARAS